MKTLIPIALVLGLFSASGRLPAQTGFVYHPISTTFDGAFSVYAADMDGDGDMDVLGAAVSDDKITWWENTYHQIFIEHTIDSTFNGALMVFACDMDLDGDMDVLGSAFYGDEIAWWENGGSQNFTKHTIRSNYAEAREVSAIDMDGDLDIDVVGCSEGLGRLDWWENDGNQIFIEHTIAPSISIPIPLYVMDMDGDTDVDILLGENGSAIISWWENDGNQDFTRHVIATGFSHVWDVFAIDLDYDGDQDVLGAAWSEGDLSWWENDGNQNFVEHIIPGPLTSGGRCVGVSDLDADGDQDVFGGFQNGNAFMAWFENNGGQTFSEHVISTNFNYPISICAANINEDVKPDLLAAAYEGDAIAWWENFLGLSVTLSPNNPPIQIPATGGSFDYTIGVINNSDSTANCQVWCSAVLPNGNPYGPVLGPVALQLPSGINTARVRNQNVPASAPAGSYIFRSFIGIYGFDIWDQDSFMFTKLASGSQSGGLLAKDSGFGDWTNTGEDFSIDVGARRASPLQPASGSEATPTMQVLPNPFNPTTVLSFELRAASFVNLSVYDISGRLVATLVDGWREAGMHQVTFDGAGLAAGVYLYRLELSGSGATPTTKSEKMILLK